MTEEEKGAYLKKLVQNNIDQHNKITALSKKVYDLQKESYRKEAQIEKMKSCVNCRYCINEKCPWQPKGCGMKHWELKEIKEK